MELELQAMYRFARRVPDIGELGELELRMLVLHNFFPMFAVRQAFRYDIIWSGFFVLFHLVETTVFTPALEK